MKGNFMNDPKLNKFIALYSIPSSVMADWAKTDPDKRKTAEEKMKAEWQKWMGDHGKMVKLTEAAGKTKRITASGISDTKNDICLYSFIEADSHEAAAKIFKDHPHLQIPQSSIEVMAVRGL
jgi:hypothetical protein